MTSKVSKPLSISRILNPGMVYDNVLYMHAYSTI